MPHEPSGRVSGRNFAVREYAQWLNAMGDRQYIAMRNGYNTRGARRNIETFEDSLRSFDRELEEYLQMNRAAGFRSAPGPTLINDMLTMWLGRDVGGEPAPGVADEWRTVSGRAGFRPIGDQGVGNHRGGYHPGRNGGPRQRSPFDDAFEEDGPSPNRRRHPPSREPRNPPMAAPGGNPRNAYGTHPSQPQPSRGDHGPRRRGTAPPVYGGWHPRNPFSNAFDDDDFAPRGAAHDPYGSHRNRLQQPGRGDYGPRRRGGAPPVRGPHDRAPAHGPSRRSTQPPRGQRLSSAAYYSEEESEDEFWWNPER